jgi:hypothetical protein
LILLTFASQVARITSVSQLNLLFKIWNYTKFFQTHLIHTENLLYDRCRRCSS